MSKDWEDVPSSTGGWEDVSEGEKDPSLLEKINAGVEATANTAAGLLGGVTTGPLAFGTNLLNTAVREGRLITPQEGYEAYSRASNIAAEPLMEKSSKLGQEYTEKVGHVMEQLIPIMPIHATLPHLNMPKVKLPPELEFEAKLKAAQEKPAEVAKTAAKGDWEDLPNLKATEGEGGQMALWDIDEAARMRNPTEAVTGDWRIDENGIPIKADLSMDVRNAEEPLQRNLWGDELAQKHPQEAERSLPEAIDAMPNLPWKSERDVGLDLLKHDLYSEELGHAARDAEVMTERSPYTDPTISRVPNSQRGAINPEVFREGFEKLKKLADGTWLRATSDGQHLTIKVIKDSHELGGAVFRPENNLGAMDAASVATGLKPEARGKGLPTEIYKFASELGNDIIPSKIRTKDGSAMWDRFKQNGLAVGDSKPFIPKSQRGGVNIDAINESIQSLKDKITRLEASGLYKNLNFVQKYEMKGPLVRELTALYKQAGDFHESRIARERQEQLNTLRDSLDGIVRDVNDAQATEARKEFTVVPKGQKGAVYFGKQKQLEKVLGRDGTMIPENPNPKDVISAALAEGRDGGKMRLHESGSTSAALKRDSAAIRGVSRTLQNAEKAGDLQIRKMVLPAENALRTLRSDEMIGLQKTMMVEMLSGERFSLDKLENFFSPKQLKAYAHLRKGFEDSLRIQNEARKIQGKKPITEMEAYLSSRWEGDFRRPLYEAVLDKNGNPKLDKEGNIQKKLVWYLAANTKRGLEKQTQTLLKERPDLTFDPKDDHTVRHYKRQTDLQSAFSTILDILDRDDPAVAKIQEAVKEQAMNESASFLGQEKHFKEKTGVRGFVGDRPGANPAKEARAFFQQQIQYMKNGYKWSEIQKASDLVKEVVSNPDLIKQQPNNIAYIKDYYKNVIGYGESRVIAHAEDAIRDLGVSPSQIDKAVGSMKSFFILQKLFSIPYVVTNAIQTTSVLPYLTDIGKKYGVNPANMAAAVPVGLVGGLTMALTHYGKQAAIRIDNPFFTNAMKYMEKNWDALRYAEDNGATARSIYDESPIEASFSIPGKVGTAMGKAIASPEVFVRSVAFTTFAHALKSSKKVMSDLEAFQLAEEYTNMSMVDYRSAERPMVFNKMGILGNFLNTLQTYPMSFYNQWNYFGREALKGNIAPFAAAFALQYALAGAVGMPYANDMFKMYDYLKDNLVSTKYWQKAQESKFWSNPKLWMMENFGSSSVYGALSDKTGIGLTSRVTAPGVTDMVQAPGGPAIEMGKQALNIGKAMLDPTNTTKIGQAVHSVTPVGLQGLLETSDPMEGIAYDKRPDGKTATMSTTDFSQHRDVYNRTPEENTIRKWGFRSQPEVVERELGYMANKNTKLAESKAKDLVSDFYDAVKRGDKKEAQELYEIHAKITGTGISDQALEKQIEENYLSTMERSATAAKSVTALQNVKRMHDILNQIKKDAGK